MRFIAPRLAFLSTLCVLFAPRIGHAQAVDPNKEPPTEAAASSTEFLHLINLETPATLLKRKTLYGIDVRPFGSSENSTYVQLEGMYGLTDRLTVLARGGGSMRRYFQNGLLQVPHGGQEVELGLRYGLPSTGNYKLGVQGSILYDNTLRDNQFLFAAQGMASRSFFNDKLVAFLSPRVFLADRSFGTFGVGVTYQISNDFALIADGQLSIFGDNAVRVSNGSGVQQEIYGVGFRYSPPSILNGKASLDFGVTNGLGRTSGFSASPGLSGSAAIYVNFGYKL